jgi:hypothetical protein
MLVLLSMAAAMSACPVAYTRKKREVKPQTNREKSIDIFAPGQACKHLKNSMKDSCFWIAYFFILKSVERGIS